MSPTFKRIALFAALSLAAHAVTLGGLRIAVPEADAPEVLETRLEPQAKAVPAPVAAPTPRRATPRAAPPPTPASPALTLPGPSPAPREQVAVAETSVPVADLPPETPTTAPAPPEPAAPLAVRQLPRHGEIRYQVFYGTDKFSVGAAQAVWDTTDSTYRIRSQAETEGLAELFASRRFSYVSEGRVTPTGLQPDALLVSRARRGRSDDFTTRFDWAVRELTLGPQAVARQVPLATGTQDIVSFTYQLALLPLAPGRLELIVTNGFKLETYEVEVGNEELLETPLGNLRTVPLRQIRRPNKEGVEIWLALDYHRLPVRVRFLDREGRMSGEQLATSIRVSAE
ncbi:MAG: DUF3108 domain-containing protein [Burkholderiales bacterium]